MSGTIIVVDALKKRIEILEAENARLREAVRDLLADREAWRIARDTRDRAKAALGETQ
jgi:hypothetical protein